MYLKPLQSQTQPVFLPELTAKDVSLFVQREDLLHPNISGNKYRKLAYNIEEAKRLGKRQLLTFGGAYSNHILATASAGNEFGFETIGFIRGDELGLAIDKTLKSNSTLRAAKDFGMQLRFLSRSDYRMKEEALFLERLQKEFPDAYFLAEGGSNALAVQGCEAILNKDAACDVVCVAVGTGATISGIINSTEEGQQVYGFPALKGDFLASKIREYTADKDQWQLVEAYHFGGYAKTTPELIAFMNAFKAATGILLDPVYTAKMMYGVLDLVRKNHFPKGTNILAIHTGGIQGIAGVNALLTKKGQPLIEV